MRKEERYIVRHNTVSDTYTLRDKQSNFYFTGFDEEGLKTIRDILNKQDQQLAELKAENGELQQQLKEKDEEIENLKHCLNTIRKEYNKLETKDEEWKEKYFYYFNRCEEYETEIDKLDTQLKTNTHQVCEKIYNTADKLSTKASFYSDKGMAEFHAITFNALCELLDQIERGEL